MANQLERSDILFEFLAIMRSAPILSLPLRPVQSLLIRAAIDLTPPWLRTIVGLTDHGLNALEAGVVRQIGAFADRLVLETNPAVQACRRMRLPANYLYVHDNVLCLNLDRTTMSPIGTKQTFHDRVPTSAIGRKADIVSTSCNVR